MQRVLISIVLVLTVMSSLLCGMVFMYLLHKGERLHDALSFTVVLMVASIPMAIEIVTTTTLSLGSGELSDRGAIVTRLTAIEDMAGMTILCSDKTGTLTMNKMVIQDFCPTYVPNETQYSLLRYAAMAAKWKEPPRDALDTLILTQVDMPSMSTVTQLDYMPFDPVLFVYTLCTLCRCCVTLYIIFISKDCKTHGGNCARQYYESRVQSVQRCSTRVAQVDTCGQLEGDPRCSGEGRAPAGHEGDPLSCSGQN